MTRLPITPPVPPPAASRPVIDPDVTFVITPTASVGVDQYGSLTRLETWESGVRHSLIPPGPDYTALSFALLSGDHAAIGSTVLPVGPAYLAGRYTAPIETACDQLDRARTLGALAVEASWDLMARYNAGEAFNPGYFGQPQPPAGTPAELYFTYGAQPDGGVGFFGLRVRWGPGHIVVETTLPPRPFRPGDFPGRINAATAPLFAGTVPASYRQAIRCGAIDPAACREAVLRHGWQPA
jgi:hypothetical protein